MLHYFNAEKTGRFQCYFCGEPIVPKWRNPDARSHHITEDLLPGEDYAIDREEWEASPSSCRKLNPLDLSIFDKVESSSTMGYRHDPDAIAITDDVLAERLARFTPLVMKDGTASRFDLPDLRRTAYTWEPKNLQAVEIIEDIMTSPTHHGCGYYGFFKPSIAEVLAQVPADLPARANAFYLDDSQILIARCGGGQLARAHWVKI